MINIVGNRINNFNNKWFIVNGKVVNTNFRDVYIETLNNFIGFNTIAEFKDFIGESIRSWTTIFTVEFNTEIIFGTTGIVGSS